MSKQIKIYELEEDFKRIGTLEFASRMDKTLKSESKMTGLLFSHYDDQPLAKKWSIVSALYASDSRSCSDADVFSVELRFAVSERTKKVFESMLGDVIEFLPIQVTGKIKEVDDERITVPSKRTRKLFLMRPTKLVQLAKGSVVHEFPACLKVSRYAFHTEDIANAPAIFRVPETFEILVTDEFRKIVEKNSIFGFSFDNKIPWSPVSKSANSKASQMKASSVKDKKETKSVPPPKPISAIGKQSGMTQSLWKQLVDHWKWSCIAAKARGGESRLPKIEKPVNKSQLAKLKNEMKCDLPQEFEHVLLNFSRKVKFWWYLQEGESPDLFGDCAMGGGGELWDISLLPETAAAAANHENAPWITFRDGLRGRLPFLHVGNGDLLAFDMRRGSRNCPVVYLCHENDEKLHDRRLGSNFIDFLINWSNIGCVDPDLHYLDMFYDRKKKQINGFNRIALRWRQFLATGK
ncbi:MAG: SMI1/KNR4 family protein [Pirellulaceae bacterium]